LLVPPSPELLPLLLELPPLLEPLPLPEELPPSLLPPLELDPPASFAPLLDVEPPLDVDPLLDVEPLLEPEPLPEPLPELAPELPPSSPLFGGGTVLPLPLLQAAATANPKPPMHNRKLGLSVCFIFVASHVRALQGGPGGATPGSLPDSPRIRIESEALPLQ